MTRKAKPKIGRIMERVPQFLPGIRVYTVDFEGHDDITQARIKETQESAPYALRCTVLAYSTENAIAKIKEVCPDLPIESIHLSYDHKRRRVIL